jgi:hypothetical protein
MPTQQRRLLAMRRGIVQELLLASRVPSQRIPPTRANCVSAEFFKSRTQAIVPEE